MLREVEQNLGKGDIVVLSFEYHVNLTGDPKLLTHTVRIFPMAIQYFVSSPIDGMKYDMEKWVEDIQETALFGRRTKNSENDSPYRRVAFSERGDVVGHLNKESAKKLPSGRMGDQDYDGFITRVNEFAHIAKSRGASVYFMFPPYAQSAFKLNEREIMKYQRACVAKLNMEILNTPEEFAYPDDHFFDTVYHLNKGGRDLRTAMTLQILSGIATRKSHGKTR
jgi:hypothetical protein